MTDGDQGPPVSKLACWEVVTVRPRRPDQPPLSRLLKKADYNTTTGLNIF